MKRGFALFLCALLCIAFSACSAVEIPADSTGTLRFIYEKEKIITEIGADDLRTLAEMFRGREMYSDSPSCGFSEDISLVIGGQTFCFANDGCAIIYISEKNRYFRITHEESVTLREILTSYGFHFPCR